MTAFERTRFFILSFFIVCSLVIWAPQFSKGSSSDCWCLEVSFLDVGQGDSILITAPDGTQMLVDAGADAGVLRELHKQMGFFDREIDVAVATHPDLDHIGGLSDVFYRYDIDAFVGTTNLNETKAAAALESAVANERSTYVYAEAGQVIALGRDVSVQVLAPSGDETDWPSNNASIVLRVVYGDTAFMLTGDLPKEIEDHLVSLYGAQLESDVLKLGHHGSKTSTSDEWLGVVQPRFAVVSAGIDNTYGHPHQEVMQRVFARNIAVSHTGTDGTITFVSDGETVWVK